MISAQRFDSKCALNTSTFGVGAGNAVMPKAQAGLRKAPRDFFEHGHLRGGESSAQYPSAVGESPRLDSFPEEGSGDGEAETATEVPNFPLPLR